MVTCAATKQHPKASINEIFQGSSIAPDVITAVGEMVACNLCVMVSLESNHTLTHVPLEFETQVNLTTTRCNCIAFNTVAEYPSKGRDSISHWDLITTRNWWL